jgi:hypothetical protein
VAVFPFPPLPKKERLFIPGLARPGLSSPFSVTSSKSTYELSSIFQIGEASVNVAALHIPAALNETREIHFSFSIDVVPDLLEY